MTSGKASETETPQAEGVVPTPLASEIEPEGEAAAEETSGPAAAGGDEPGTAAPGTEAPGTEALEAVAPVEPTPEKQITDLKDQLLRAMAETENIRKRSRRDVEETSKYGISSFARDVLTIGDNLARALESVPVEARENNTELGTLLEGVELTQREFLTLIERHGIKRIDPIGERFDHNFHQAVFEIEDPDNDPGTVVQVIQSGYVISGRLLRAAMVGLAKKPGGGGNEPAESSGALGGVDTKV